MRNYIKYLSLFAGIIMFFGCTDKIFAQTIRLTATVNKNVLKVNERLELTLTIHGTHDTPPPSFPSVEGFTLLFGPRISAQTRLINGDISVSKGYTYVLQPAATGRFTIGASEVEYQGKTYSSNPITVEVFDTSSADTELPDFEKHVFAELSVDKSEAYLYEQVILSFKFYFQRGLPVSNIDYVAPATRNFMEEKLGDQRQYEEVRDGIIYNVLELRTAVFPIVAGELTISPANLKCDLIIQQQRSRRGSYSDSFYDDAFFDSFFGREQKRHTIERVTKPVTVKVKPLPEKDKPEEFGGAVGSYNMDVSIKSQQVKIGDPITVSISVYGEGNIQTIHEPLLIMNKEGDFKLYPAETVTQITNREEGIRGRKVFSKVIEPQRIDLEYTPAIIFSFFDPREGQYKTIVKEPIPITVEAGQQEIPLQLAFSQDRGVSVKRQTRIVTKDILPIMTNSALLRNQGNLLYKSPYVIAGLSLPVIAVVVSLFMTRHRERLLKDIGYARNRRAYAAARKRLTAVQAERIADNPAEYYSELSRALADYLADKLNISAANAADERIGDLLKQRGAGDDTIKEISRCFTHLDYRRFSKDKGTEDEMAASLELTTQLITNLEKQL
ncbi:MAG: BatD family protein [Candidatus Loosdrechtia sp.]|nr:MAG: BatD family protein [Candidatus Jettenia sp. AMX2]